MNCLCGAMQDPGWPMLRQKRYLRWRWMQSSGMTQDMKFIIKSWWVIKRCLPCMHFELLIQSWTDESLMAMFCLSDVDAESANKKLPREKIMIMIFLVLSSMRVKLEQCHQRGWKVTEPHMRGNSDSSCPCTGMSLDALIWRILVPQSICLIVSVSYKGYRGRKMLS